jgi:hypothetical protein
VIGRLSPETLRTGAARAGRSREPATDHRRHTRANDVGRFSRRTKNQNLTYGDDGSLTLMSEANDPPILQELANWLPAPSDDFSVYLRAD